MMKLSKSKNKIKTELNINNVMGLNIASNKKDANSKYEQLIDANSQEIDILAANEIKELKKSAMNIYACDFGCHFDRKSQKEIAKNKKARKKLLAASVFCVIFMIAELTGGYIANSVALMSDALHLLSDCGGLMISVFALWMTQKDATHKLTYGYHRAEIVGALFSVFLIWGLTIWLVYEAIHRLIEPHTVNGEIMFIVAVCGIIVNIVMGGILHQGGHHGHSHGHGHGHSHGHDHNHDDHDDHSDKHDCAHDHDHDNSDDNDDADHSHSHHSHHSHSHDNSHSHNDNKQHKEHKNINVRSAFIHVLGDLLQSIGVLVAAILIWYDEPKYHWADPVCTLIFSIIVLFTTVNLLRDTLGILMESVPSDISLIDIAKELQSLTDVAEVHDLHVWNLSLGKPALSVHLLVQSSTLDIDGKIIPACADGVLRKAQIIIKKKFNIEHSTIQIEWPHATRNNNNNDNDISCPDYCDNDHKLNNEHSHSLHSSHISHNSHSHSSHSRIKNGSSDNNDIDYD